MKLSRVLMLASIAFIAPAVSDAQVAGTTLLGVSYGELRDVTLGWSAKRQILGQPVFNDQNERVGSVEDVIVGGDKTVTYAIINAGGFTGLTKHDVAVPVSKFKLMGGKLTLEGATKDALKASPPFEYAN
jgi:sporulation protein YlmC with PRC-barrel domain